MLAYFLFKPQLLITRRLFNRFGSFLIGSQRVLSQCFQKVQKLSVHFQNANQSCTVYGLEDHRQAVSVDCHGPSHQNWAQLDVACSLIIILMYIYCNGLQVQLTAYTALRKCHAKPQCGLYYMERVKAIISCLQKSLLYQGPFLSSICCIWAIHNLSYKDLSTLQ